MSFLGLSMRVLALLFACCLSMQARAWPDRPVHLVVPYPPGAMGDTVARLVADEMQRSTGQAVIVENRSGAAGNIGAGVVAQATDDYTFLVAATNNLVINQYLYASMPFDPLTAFKPVTMLVDVPMAIFINAKVPANTLDEFRRLATQQRGQFNYASPGSGTTVHLFSEALSRAWGADMSHVPYKGASQALGSVLAGETQMLVIGAGVGAPHVRQGRLKALAISLDHRTELLPGVPTFREVGLSDLTASNWWALVAPARVPDAVVQRLHEEVAKALRTPHVAARIQELGAVDAAKGPADLRERMKEESVRWQAMVRSTGIKAD